MPLASWPANNLTTNRQLIEKIVKIAAKYIIDNIHKKKVNQNVLSVKGELIIRNATLPDKKFQQRQGIIQ